MSGSIDKNARAVQFIAKTLAPAPPMVKAPTGEMVATVPHDVFWLVAGDEFVGTVNVRHRLRPFLERYGGHIGYSVRPRVWGRGHGKMLLALGLRYARSQLRLERILITCNDDNLASIRVVQANGGQRFEVTPHPFVAGKLLRLYWISD